MNNSFGMIQQKLQLNGEIQFVRDYIIYPQYYFIPTKGDVFAKVDERAYSIHHYAATWFPRGARVRNTVKRFLGHKFMDKYYKIVKRK